MLVQLPPTLFLLAGVPTPSLASDPAVGEQTDVLSTSLPVSPVLHPQGDAAGVDVIVKRGVPPGCVVGRRRHRVNLPLGNRGSINLHCDGKFLARCRLRG